VPQELDDLGELFLHLVEASDVGPS